MARKNPSELKDITADDVRQSKDIVIEPVDVPEWGGRVYVRTLSGREKEKYLESVRKTIGKGRNATEKVILEESSAKLVAACTCDKTGRLIFTVKDVPMLASKSSKALDRVVEKASQLNGLDDEAEEAAKNDSPASLETSDDSNTDSPDI